MAYDKNLAAQLVASINCENDLADLLTQLTGEGFYLSYQNTNFHKLRRISEKANKLNLWLPEHQIKEMWRTSDKTYTHFQTLVEEYFAQFSTDDKVLELLKDTLAVGFYQCFDNKVEECLAPYIKKGYELVNSKLPNDERCPFIHVYTLGKEVKFNGKEWKVKDLYQLVMGFPVLDAHIKRYKNGSTGICDADFGRKLKPFVEKLIQKETQYRLFKFSI